MEDSMMSMAEAVDLSRRAARALNRGPVEMRDKVAREVRAFTTGRSDKLSEDVERFIERYADAPAVEAVEADVVAAEVRPTAADLREHAIDYSDYLDIIAEADEAYWRAGSLDFLREVMTSKGEVWRVVPDPMRQIIEARLVADGGRASEGESEGNQ